MYSMKSKSGIEFQVGKNDVVFFLMEGWDLV